jgi:2-polyprenyl-6-methoxyphenol hydroxylase-like FAD-dependent oxidoreductase
MTPVNGQGMNTGVQDSFNLAWKLQLAIAGAAPAVLDAFRIRAPTGCHRHCRSLRRGP